MATLYRILESNALRESLCNLLDAPFPVWEPEYIQAMCRANPEYLAGRLSLMPQCKAELLHVLDKGSYLEDIGGLMGSFPNELRGMVAVLLYLYGDDVPLDIYREELQSAWNHDHRQVERAARTRQRLRAMFKRAKYPLPEEWPETVRIWRGTSYLPERLTAKGIAWTIDRDVACWFAMRFAEKNGHPLVLVADVPKSSIMLYIEGEDEAVCFDVVDARIDGCPEDWQAGHDRNQRRINVASEKIFS